MFNQVKLYMKKRCSVKFVFLYVRSFFVQQSYTLGQNPTSHSSMQIWFWSPEQMINIITGIIAMSSSNRWMTEIGEWAWQTTGPVDDHI